MADFFIRVKVDPSGAVVGTRAVGAGLAGVEQRAKSLQATLIRTFAIFGAAAGVAGTIRLLADFSQEMSTVRAVTGATDEQFQQLRDTAKELGATTRFTATEAASGMVLLARAGFTAAESIDTIDDTLKLAQAGALDLASAADITAKTIRGFRLETDQASRVVDVLALASIRSNTNVQQLGEALKFVAPVAAGVGVSLEETVAIITQLSDAGLQASLAGTGLRRVLAELESVGGPAAKILKDIGVSSDDVKISTVGVITAFQLLEKQGVDTGKALEIFGQRGGPAFEVISNGIPAIQEMIENLKAAGGTADEIARIMDENLNGAMLRTRSAFEAVQIAIGDLGAESDLTQFFDNLARLFRQAAENIETIAKFAKAAGIAIAVFFVRRGLLAAIPAIIKMSKALLTAQGRMAALGGAVTILVALLVAFSDQIAISEGGITNLADVGTASIQLINESLDELQSIFTGTFNDAEDDGVKAANNIALAFLSLIRAVAQAIDFVTKPILTQFNIISRAVLEISKGNFKGLGAAVREEFLNGLQQNILTDQFDKLLDRADDIAAERDAKRRRDEDRARREAESAPPRTVEQIAAEVQPLAPGGDKFSDVLADLNEEIRLLKILGAEQQIQAEVSAIEADIEEKLLGVRRQAIEERLRQIQALQTYNDLIESSITPLQQIAEQERQLQLLLDQNVISIEQFNAAMLQLGKQALQFRADLDAGFTRGLESIRENIADLASASENLIVNAFRGAEEAIVQFVTTGEADIKRFVDQVLADLTRLIIRQALLSAFPGLAPAGGAIPGFQTGGRFTVGGSGGPDSQLVAFRASPGEPVAVGRDAIRGAPGQQQQQAPNVNIRSVTVFDPQIALDAMETPRGERVLLNMVRRNKEQIKRQLS